MLLIAGAITLTLPGIFLRLTGIAGDPRAAAAIYGMAVVGAAFLLAWAAEIAQRGIPRSLALTILALIVVLPEYAVDSGFSRDTCEDERLWLNRMAGHELSW